MAAVEYLVSHGHSGGFGRFVAATPLSCRRGERVVVRSGRGLELGAVLCPATDRQQQVLRDTPVGELLRPATPEDEQQAQRMADRGRELFDQAQALAGRLALEIAVLDVEVCLDGSQAILQHLAPQQKPLDAFVRELEESGRLKILLENLAVPAPAVEEEHGGCGQPGCGRTAGGGCSTCGSGGGCSSCGSGGVDLRQYFAHLRTQMEERTRRTPLN
jgi:cell fate regulator YaaT (PSP1 superfamily)